jgi:hypothetical protein
VRFACRIVLLPMAIAVAVGGVAQAQTQPQIPGQGSDPTDTRIFMPYPDGDPNKPQRFRKPSFGNPPGFGAGTTGFDSTNVKANKKMARPPVPPPPLPPLAPVDQTVAPIYREPVVARPVPLMPAPAYQNSVQQRPQVVRRGPIDEDPFGPLGIRSPNNMIWKPAVELTGGYDTNVPRSLQKQGSPFWMVAPELLAKSDWSRHEFVFEGKSSYTWYTNPEVENFNKPMIDLKTKTRIDIARDTRADLESRFNLAADSPGNPNDPEDIKKPPIYMVYGSTAGITQRFNRLEVTVKGSADRTAYQDAELNDGGTLDLTDRNYNQYAIGLRGAYEVSPGIKPFVEVGGDKRKHDPTTCSCEDRNSDGRTFKGGVQFELTRKLTGEVSVGEITRDYADPGLPTLRGTLVDGALIYYATPLTTLKFDAKTSVAESSIAGVSGTLTRDYTLQADHSFRRWLIGTLKAGYGTDDYDGLDRLDKRYFVSAGLIYKLNRNTQLKGEFRQDWLRSNVTSADYTASTVMFGLRLQQ